MNATKTILVRAFNRAGMWFLITVVAAILLNSMPQEKMEGSRPVVENTPTAVMDRHDAECWDFTKSDPIFPKGVFMDSVIVQWVGTNGGATERVYSQKVIDRTWKDIVSKKDTAPELRPMAICWNPADVSSKV